MTTDASHRLVVRSHQGLATSGKESPENSWERREGVQRRDPCDDDPPALPGECVKDDGEVVSPLLGRRSTQDVVHADQQDHHVGIPIEGGQHAITDAADGRAVTTIHPPRHGATSTFSEIPCEGPGETFFMRGRSAACSGRLPHHNQPHGRRFIGRRRGAAQWSSRLG